MKTKMTDCQTVQDLWDRQATGALLTDDEKILIPAHLDVCEECALEAKALDVLRAELQEPTLRFMDDDIARRRWIDASIVKASNSSVRTKRPGFGVLGFAAAAAVLLAIIGTFYFTGSEDNTRISPQVTANNSSAQLPLTQLPLPVGQVLLASGNGPFESLPLNSEFKEGSRFQISDGTTVISLGEGIMILLEQKTEIVLREMNSSSIAVSVERGALLASVDPHRNGPKFSVITTDGTVEVTGTIFCVNKNEKNSEVSVYRGSVRVFTGAGNSHSVRSGETTVLGDSNVKPVSETEDTWSKDALKLMDLLGSGEDATVMVRSLPQGAVVTLDDVILGQTPLRARIRKGHRVVDLSLPDHAPVREQLDIGPGEEISRVFELTSVPAVASETNTGTLTKPKPAAAKQNPSQMLARAQALRTGREWKKAADAYSDLIKTYPSSIEAQTSLISLGGIQLDHLGRPSAALKSFERYLRRVKSGTLAQEAAFDRSRALRKLGQNEKERQALEHFLTSYPNAVQASMARARLKDFD